MENPFTLSYPDQEDSKLVQLAVDGQKEALQTLVQRHQIFVYNLALKMTRSPADAEDLTQEVFIKGITSLAKFEGKSKFRTWLYRITVNHFLNTKKKKAEFQIVDFESYFNAVDEMPDAELSDDEQYQLSETIEDLRIRCTAGMLMCLDREQRLIYILGEMFGIDHNLGAEILGISSGNFRIRLMRARNDLYQWMNKRCGLVNKANPCRCSKKTKTYLDSGLVDQQNLQFNSNYRKKIYELSEKEAVAITDTVEELHKRVFLDHPLQQPLNPGKIVEEIFNNELIKGLLKM